MKIALQALAAAALLSLAAHAIAAPVTKVTYFSEDLSDAEPGKDRWVFHYSVIVGKGLELGSLFGLGFDGLYFDNLALDVLDNPAVAGSVRQPDAAKKLPGAGILELLDKIRETDRIDFDVSFDRVGAALPKSQPFEVAVFDGERLRVIQRGTAERIKREVPAIPEPATLALLLPGLLGVAVAGRRRAGMSSTKPVEAGAEPERLARCRNFPATA